MCYNACEGNTKLNIEISPLEARLSLGIYADTNCLTFESTTAEDAYTVGFLLPKEQT